MKAEQTALLHSCNQYKETFVSHRVLDADTVDLVVFGGNTANGTPVNSVEIFNLALHNADYATWGDTVQKVLKGLFPPKWTTCTNCNFNDSTVMFPKEDMQ